MISVIACIVFGGLLALWLIDRMNSRDAYRPPLADVRWYMPVSWISHTFELLTNRHFGCLQMKKYGPLVRVNLMVGPRIFVGEANAVRTILRMDGKVMSTLWPQHWTDLAGRGSVMVMTGDRHIKMRKMLAKSFTPAALTGYYPMIIAATDIFMREWIMDSMDSSVPLFPRLKVFAMNVILRVLFSADMTSDKRLANMSEDFVKWYAAFSATFPVYFPGSSISLGMKARNNIINALTEMVKERQELFGHEDDEKTDILHNILSDDAFSLSKEEIADTLLSLIFAGYDTTASAMSSALYYYGVHLSKDYRDRLFKEVDEAFSDSSQSFDHCKLMQLPLLNAFVKEVLRVNNPVIGSSRQVIEDFTHIVPAADSPNGAREIEYRFKKGEVFIIGHSFLSRDDRYYTNSEKFDPERFLPGREEDKNRGFTNKPFGGGIRLCLGMNLAKMELCLLIVNLIRKYDVTITSSDERIYPFSNKSPCGYLRRRQ